MQTSKRANICFCHIGRSEMNFWKLNRRIRLPKFQRLPAKIDAVCADSGGRAGWVLNNNISGIGHGENGLRLDALDMGNLKFSLY